MRSLALTLVAVLAACSILPSRDFPAADEREVEATFDFGSAPVAAVRVPTSGPDLTVFRLELSPPPIAETFDRDGTRRLLPSAATSTLRCRYRVYAADDGAVPQPAELFPDAARIRTLWRRVEADDAPR